MVTIRTELIFFWTFFVFVVAERIQDLYTGHIYTAFQNKTDKKRRKKKLEIFEKLSIFCTKISQDIKKSQEISQLDLYTASKPCINTTMFV